LDIKTTSLCGPAGCFFFPLTKAVYMHIWFGSFLFNRIKRRLLWIYCCIKKNWGPSNLEAQLCRPVCTGLGPALILTSHYFYLLLSSFQEFNDVARGHSPLLGMI
jgi:hypothetical protein